MQNCQNLQASNNDECYVCHMRISISFRIPGCNHKYCYLCAKGLTENVPEGQKPKCGYCRHEFETSDVTNYRAQLNAFQALSPAQRRQIAEIDPIAGHIDMTRPDGFGEEEEEQDVKPNLAELQAQMTANGIPLQPGVAPINQINPDEDKPVFQLYYWLYSARTENCWWRFDPNHELFLEAGWRNGMRLVHVGAGAKTIECDLAQGIQYSINGPRYPRNIRRVSFNELRAMGKNFFGVAGVRVEMDTSVPWNID